MKHVARPRGRKPHKFDTAVEAMRADQARGKELENEKEETLAKRYGVSRDTCRRALDRVLSKIVEN